MSMDDNCISTTKNLLRILRNLRTLPIKIDQLKFESIPLPCLALVTVVGIMNVWEKNIN